MGGWQRGVPDPPRTSKPVSEMEARGFTLLTPVRAQTAHLIMEAAKGSELKRPVLSGGGGVEINSLHRRPKRS